MLCDGTFSFANACVLILIRHAVRWKVFVCECLRYFPKITCYLKCALVLWEANSHAYFPVLNCSTLSLNILSCLYYCRLYDFILLISKQPSKLMRCELEAFEPVECIVKKHRNIEVAKRELIALRGKNTLFCRAKNH